MDEEVKRKVGTGEKKRTQEATLMQYCPFPITYSLLLGHCEHTQRTGFLRGECVNLYVRQMWDGISGQVSSCL